MSNGTVLGFGRHDSRLWIVLVAIGYLLIATSYSIVTPIFEASDELWHFPMVDYLANNQLQLPVQDASNVGRWRQEGSQPPLYYMLSALLIAGIDRTDLDYVRYQNPHADIGIVVPDGNANMIVHRAELEQFPWQKTVLAVHIVRFFSILLGLGTILVTNQITREVFPEYPLVAVGAAAINAFLPMFLFISASVNNDNLSNLLGNLLTLMMVRLLKVKSRPHWRSYALIGVVVGCGLLAKLNLGFWIPVFAVVLIIISIRLRDPLPVVVGGLVSGTITAVVAGWWYWRNWQLYGDPTGLNVFLDIVGRRAIQANVAQLWSERHSFTQSFWGFFGGVNVPMSDNVYAILNIVGFVAVVSSLVFIAYHLARHTFPMMRWIIVAITLIWPIVTFISYLRWTAETPASQGRLIFGALSSSCLWISLGCIWFLPKPIRLVPIAAVATLLLVIAATSPFVTIAPAYALPEIVEFDEGNPTAQFTEPQSSGEISLVSAEVVSRNAQPDSYVEVLTTWQISEPIRRDWSLFVHLVSPEGVIIGQRDVYPGQGSLATSTLSSGQSWQNRLSVWVPSAAYTPARLSVQIGWYYLPTGERMLLSDGETTVTVGQVELLPRSDPINLPNPIRINFDNQIELVAYQLSTLAPSAGETIDLTLYWQRLRSIQQDYTVFVHILNPTTQAIYAASDKQPVAGNAPTSRWEEQQIITDRHQLQVADDAPSEMVELEIGLYVQTADGGFQRLRVVTPDGGMANDFAYLSKLRILPNFTQQTE